MRAGILIAIGAALVLALAFGLALRRPVSHVASTPEQSDPTPETGSGSGSTIASAWPRAARPNRARQDAGRPSPGRPGDTSPTATSDASGSRAWLDQLLDEGAELKPVSREVVDRWLASGRTNAADLLAARQAAGEREYLLQALTNFPNDPGVLLAATVLKDSPDEQRQRLERFKAAAPDNALADYLSARLAFQEGRPEEALGELATGNAKRGFDDYTLDAMQNAEELYLLDGRSPAEAKALGVSSTLLPHLAELKGLAQDIVALQKQYVAAGDLASASRLAEAGVQLGQRFAGGEASRTLIGNLVGLAIERMVLHPLSSDDRQEFLSGTVAEYMAGLDARRATVRESTQHFDDWMRSASEADLISYFDRLKIYGEAEALKWMNQRRGQP